LTGTRADFGKLRPLMDKIEGSEMLENYIFVTGMHTLAKYGPTFLEVQKQNYKNVFIYMNQTHTTDLDTILANTITGFGNFIKEIKPDMIVIHGDRVEALSGAIVGAFNNILVSHIEGGEISGTIDESIRHSVTKLSHIHFVSNVEAKNRLIQMGERKSSIFVIGSPDIDVMMSSNLPDITTVKTHYDIHFNDFGILIFHPVTTELHLLKNQVKNLVDAILQMKQNVIVVYPNNDTGSSIILNEYKRLQYKKNIRIFPSIRFEYFLTLLKNSQFIIGNSSVGIKESEIYGIPSINIGNRQNKRSANKNIINIDCYKKEIVNAINKIGEKKVRRSYTFGDGKSAEKFYEIINKNTIWKTSVQKQFVDHHNKK